MSFPLLAPLPPEYPCAAGIFVPPLLPVGHRSYRWAVTLPGCLSPGWRCSAKVSDCRSRCDRTGSPVNKEKCFTTSLKTCPELSIWVQFALFDTGCSHQLDIHMSPGNLFLKCIVHKWKPLSDFCCLFIQRGFQTAISLQLLATECSRVFGCPEQQQKVQNPPHIMRESCTEAIKLLLICTLISAHPY